MTQPAGAGAGLPASVDTLAAAVVALYAQAEQDLLASIANVASHGLTDTSAASQAAMLTQMRRAAERVLTALRLRSGVLATEIARTAAERGHAAAVQALRRAIEGHPSLAPTYLARTGVMSGHGIASAQQIGLDLAARLQATWRGIVRFADDAYRAAIAEAATRLVIGREGLTPATAQRMAWRELTRAGVSGFTDTAGRRWNLASYVEMATRTAVQRAYNASHEARMTSVGVRYFTISHDGRPCPLCKPFEGAILSHGHVGRVIEPSALTGRGVSFTVKATLDQARAAGLFHPNAVLGDRPVQPLGAVENGVRGWYSGPSVNLTTARGHHLAVSPNHPVLTSTGWLPAKLLREGMHVFSAAASHRAQTAAIADVNLDHPQATFQHELDALAAHGGRATVPATSDYLHGDGRFCQGEIEVVVADRRLLPVLHAQRVEMLGEHALPRADVQAHLGAGARTALLDRLTVAEPVARTLPDPDTTLAQPTQHRRAADAETVPEILGGLAAGVQMDELVDVQWDRYEGHAFDLQTESGAYVADSILVHNCRHTLLPYLPGVTRASGTSRWTGADERRYQATQQLRRLEREVRAAKRAQAAALDDLSRARAGRESRALQQRIRVHVDRHGLVRRRHREQLDLGHK